MTEIQAMILIGDGIGFDHALQMAVALFIGQRRLWRGKDKLRIRLVFHLKRA